MILEHRKQSVNDITEMNYIGFQNAIALLAIGDVEILFAKESCVDIQITIRAYPHAKAGIGPCFTRLQSFHSPCPLR
jgi:hypothetical protein